MNISLYQDRYCAVCLQRCHYPTQLPCGHIFCFLCVKGVARTNKKCAMCRAEIPLDYLDHPTVLEIETPQSIDNEYQWYYEGADGWWKYEERHNSELESAFNEGLTHCKLLIAGTLYSVDYQRMIQYQCRDPSKRRRVKRDNPGLPAKGIAGVKIMRTETKSESEDSSSNEADNLDTVDLTDTLDSSTDDVIEVAQETSPTVPERSPRIQELIRTLRAFSLQPRSRSTRDRDNNH